MLGQVSRRIFMGSLKLIYDPEDDLVEKLHHIALAKPESLGFNVFCAN